MRIDTGSFYVDICIHGVLVGSYVQIYSKSKGWVYTYHELGAAVGPDMIHVYT